MRTQAAGRDKARRLSCPPYAAPWSTVRTYRGQAAPSSSGHTISPHADRRSVCVSAVLPLTHHQGSCQAPSLLLHSHHSGSSRGVAYICMAANQLDQFMVATPAECMHMPPTVCPLLEPTDRHAGQTQARGPLVFIREDSRCHDARCPFSRHCYTRSLVISVHQKFTSLVSRACSALAQTSAVNRSRWLCARWSSRRPPKTDGATTALHLLSRRFGMSACPLASRMDEANTHTTTCSISATTSRLQERRRLPVPTPCPHPHPS
jgi:hypothetical protein